MIHHIEKVIMSIITLHKTQAIRLHIELMRTSENVSFLGQNHICCRVINYDFLKVIYPYNIAQRVIYISAILKIEKYCTQIKSMT